MGVVIDVELMKILEYMSLHYGGGTVMIPIPRIKMVFGGWTTHYSLLEKCGGCPLDITKTIFHVILNI